MKNLMYLLIGSSIIMGIPTNLGSFTLFATEFTGPISMLKAMTFPTTMMVIWILLLISHLALISLIFLTRYKYFNLLLILLPLLFIILYVAFATLSIILLIPFIIVWIISLFKMKAS